MNAAREEFAQRVCVVVAVVALATAIVALLWAASSVLLLIFAAILVACFLRGLAELVRESTGVSIGWALTSTIIILLGLTVLAVWLLAPNVAGQVDDLYRSLDESLQQVRAQLSRYGWGQRLIAQAPDVMELAERGNLVARITGIFSTTLGVIVNVVIVLFIGFYLAAAPGVYTSGLVRLFPKKRRAQIAEVLPILSHTLRCWLLGRSILMVSNGVLTTIGLWLLGMPLPVSLGVIAGLLNFVPNIGPIVAGVPAVLIGWMIGPTMALYVLLLYVFLQSADGYIFTPLVQARTVALPPALTIAAQVLFGVLAGSVGLLLATPLTAVALVLVRKLYVEDVLGDEDA